MAEKRKDPEDVFLENLFAAEAVADDGFSERVVGQIRRRYWMRCGGLLAAVAVGGAIAAKPALALVRSSVDVLLGSTSIVPGISASWLPSVNLMLAGAALFAVALLSLRAIED